MYQIILIKKGTKSELDTITLHDAELGYTTDTNEVYVGTGIAPSAGGHHLVGSATVGTSGNRPSAGVNGRFYFDTDTDILYVDDGAVWTGISGGGGGSSLVNIYLSAEAAYLPSTNSALLSEVLGFSTYAGWSYLAFGDGVSEHVVWRTPLPDYDGGDIIITSYTKPASTPSGLVTLQFNILTIGLSNSENFNSASPVDTGVNLIQSMDTTELASDVMITTATINPDNVSTDDLLVIGLSRDITPVDNLVGDGQLLGIMLEYTRS